MRARTERMRRFVHDVSVRWGGVVDNHMTDEPAGRGAILTSGLASGKMALYLSPAPAETRHIERALGSDYV